MNVSAFFAAPLISLLALSSLSACSDGAGSDAEPSGTASPQDSDEQVGSEPGATCEGEQADGTVCVGSVTGMVIDEDDQPVSDLAVTVCGPICFRGVTEADGSFSVELNHFIHVSEYSVQPHGTPHASTFYHLIPTDLQEGDYQAGTLRVIELEEDGPLITTKLDLEGDEVSPAQSISSAGVTLDIAEGTVVRLSVGDALEGDEGRRFRARELDEDLIAEFTPDFEGDRVFALGPFEAEFIGEDDAEPAVSLSVDNTLDWDAGAEVEVYALGTYLDPEWLSPSEFQSIGTATVSEDGTTIELPESAQGAGLNHLTWLALRP